jgi:hypothetical protein
VLGQWPGLEKPAAEGESRAAPPPQVEQAAAPARLQGEISLKSGPVSLSDRFAGRPSLKHAIFAEMQKRAAERLQCDTLAAEARHLLKWARTQYPGDPRLPGREKSLQNTIRNEYRRLRAERDGPTK